MPVIYDNPFRGQGLPLDAARPRDDARAVTALLARCPQHQPTPLLSLPDLAQRCGVASLHVKDERGRMGLGSFKALGAAYVIARDAEAGPLEGKVYATASAGNHGLSVAAGAAVFGARAIIYLSDTVPEAFADRLRGIGAGVMRKGATYEDSMDAAEADAAANGWTLLSDSTWPGTIDAGLTVMEGYTQMATEITQAMTAPPSHILLQAGVGGLAAAVAAVARKAWGNVPQIIVVEPEHAPALAQSITAGRLVTAPGPVSAMGRLDCKTPSLVALRGLSEDADQFLTLTEAEAQGGTKRLAEAGLATTPSGGAGLAALLAGIPQMPSDAHVLAILSEGPEDG